MPLLQPQFEASDNKPAVIGYSVAAVFAFFFAEWFIHLPLFNFVSGLPPAVYKTPADLLNNLSNLSNPGRADVLILYLVFAAARLPTPAAGAAHRAVPGRAIFGGALPPLLSCSCDHNAISNSVRLISRHWWHLGR